MGAGKVPVICGPTAAGKSALALELAARYERSIVSADSRQVYRGFDIGTAKPGVADRERVPHYGVDVLDPSERYSAAVFARDAETWLGDAARSGKPGMVVGGTGFYIRALVDPLADSPAFDTAQRRTLAEELAELPNAELQRWCELLDPSLAHLGRTQLLRAVETALLSGRRLSDFHLAGSERQPLAAAYLVVDPGATLGERIGARLDAMLAAGWLDEVRSLERTVPADAPAWTGTGYYFWRLAVREEMEIGEARARTLAATRQYAKRQRTWFRHQLPGAEVTRLDPTAPDAFAVAAEWLESVA